MEQPIDRTLPEGFEWKKVDWNCPLQPGDVIAGHRLEKIAVFPVPLTNPNGEYIEVKFEELQTLLKSVNHCVMRAKVAV